VKRDDTCVHSLTCGALFLVLKLQILTLEPIKNLNFIGMKLFSACVRIYLIHLETSILISCNDIYYLESGFPKGENVGIQTFM
jgi:hypothetical protein